MMASDAVQPDDKEPLSPYYCTICDIHYATENELNEHEWSLIHHVKLDQIDKKVHICELCGVAPGNLVTYTQHVNGKRHRRAILRFKKDNKVRPQAKRFLKKWMRRAPHNTRSKSAPIQIPVTNQNEGNPEDYSDADDMDDEEEEEEGEEEVEEEDEEDIMDDDYPQDAKQASAGTSRPQGYNQAATRQDKNGCQSRRDHRRNRYRSDRSSSREHHSLERRIEERAKDSKEKKKGDWSKQRYPHWNSEQNFDESRRSFCGPPPQQAGGDGSPRRWPGAVGNWGPMMPGPVGGPQSGPPPGWNWSGRAFPWNPSGNAPPPSMYLPPHGGLLQQPNWPPQDQFNMYRYSDPRFARSFQEQMNWQGNQFSPPMSDKSGDMTRATAHGKHERPSRDFRQNSQSTSDEPSDNEKPKEKRELSPNRKDVFNLSLKASKIIDDVLNKKLKATSTASAPKTDAQINDNDHGADLLERAEKLCKDLRKKRELSQVKREGLENRNQQEKQVAREKEMSNLSNRAMSRIRGYVSDEGLKAAQKSLGDAITSSATFNESSLRGSRPSFDPSSSRVWQPGRSRSFNPDQGDGHMSRRQQFTTGPQEQVGPYSSPVRYTISPDKRDVSCSRPSVKLQGSHGTASQKGLPQKAQTSKRSENLQQPSDSKLSSGSQRSSSKKISSSLARALKKRLNKPSAEVTKDELMKLVNAPRSRKERLQIAHLVQSSRLQQRLASRPRLHLGGDTDPPVDLTGDIDETQLALSLDDLPDDIKQQILQLIDEEVASQDSEVEEIDKGAMDIEELALRSDEDADLINLLSPPHVPAHAEPFHDLTGTSQAIDIKPIIKTEESSDAIADNILGEITGSGMSLTEVKSDELMLLSRLGITQDVPTKDTESSLSRAKDVALTGVKEIPVGSIPTREDSYVEAKNRTSHDELRIGRKESSSVPERTDQLENQDWAEVNDDSDASSTTSSQGRLEVGSKRRRDPSLDNGPKAASSKAVDAVVTSKQDAKRLKMDIKNKNASGAVDSAMRKASVETPMDCLSSEKSSTTVSSSTTAVETRASPSGLVASNRGMDQITAVSTVSDVTTSMATISQSNWTSPAPGSSQSQKSHIVQQDSEFSQNLRQALSNLGCSDSTIHQRLASLLSSGQSNQPNSSLSQSNSTPPYVNQSPAASLLHQSEHSPIIIDQSPPAPRSRHSDKSNTVKQDSCSDSNIHQRLVSLASSSLPSGGPLHSARQNTHLSPSDVSDIRQHLSSQMIPGIPPDASGDFARTLIKAMDNLESAGVSRPSSQPSNQSTNQDFTGNVQQAPANLLPAEVGSNQSLPSSHNSTSPRPAMPPPSDRTTPVDPDRLSASFSSTYTTDTFATSQSADCVDTVLEISLQEEAVRSKLQETDRAIERLQALLHQTQEQLKRRFQVREKLLKQEEDLRSRRIQVLKGAVADRRSVTPASSTRSNSPRVPRDVMDFADHTAPESCTSEWDSASTLHSTGPLHSQLTVKMEEPAEREDGSRPRREIGIITLDIPVDVKEEGASSVDLNTSLEPDTTTHESSIDIQTCIKQEIQQVIGSPVRQGSGRRHKSQSFSLGDDREHAKVEDDDQVHAHYVGTLQLDRATVNSSSEQELLQKLVENLATLRKTSYMVLTEDEVVDKSGSEVESQLDSSQENINIAVTSEIVTPLKDEKSPVHIDILPVKESTSQMSSVPDNPEPVQDTSQEKYEPYPIKVRQSPQDKVKSSQYNDDKPSEAVKDQPQEESKSTKKLLKSPKAKRKSPRIRAAECLAAVEDNVSTKEPASSQAKETVEKVTEENTSVAQDDSSMKKVDPIATPPSPKTKKRKARRVRDEESSRANEGSDSSSDSDVDMESLEAPQNEKANMRRRKTKKLPVETAKLVQEYFHAESSSDVEISGLERQPVPLTPPRQSSPLQKDTRRKGKSNKPRISSSPTEEVNKPQTSVLRRSRRNRKLSSPSRLERKEEVVNDEGKNTPSVAKVDDADTSVQDKKEVKTENLEDDANVSAKVEHEKKSKRSSPPVAESKKKQCKKGKSLVCKKSIDPPVPTGTAAQEQEEEEAMDTDSREASDQETMTTQPTEEATDAQMEAVEKDVTVSSSTDSLQTTSFLPVQKSLKLHPEAVEFFREAVRKGRLNIREGASPGEATMGEFHGHTGSVHCMVVYDKWLITASEDHTVRKFNLATHECEEVYRGHTKGVQCVLVTSVFPLGVRLYSGSFDNSISCFDFESGDQLMKMMCAHRVHCCSEGWGRLYVGLGNGNVLCLDLKSNKTVDTFKCSDCPIRCISTAREGARKLLVVASTDCSITIRDAHSSLLIRTLEGHTKTPMTMTVINHLVYSGGADKTVQIHNLNNGELDRCIIQRGVVTSVCLEGEVMVAAGYEGIIKVYDPKTWQLIQMYYGAGAGTITAMCLYNNMLYSGNREGLIDAVYLNPQKKYRCRFGSCGMLFGHLPHLERHVLHDHILPNQAVVRCLWKECTEYMPGNRDTKATTEHILTHISDEYKTEEEESRSRERSGEEGEKEAEEEEKRIQSD